MQNMSTEQLRDQCNEYGISFRGPKGGFKHRHTMIMLLQRVNGSLSMQHGGSCEGKNFISKKLCQRQERKAKREAWKVRREAWKASQKFSHIGTMIPQFSPTEYDIYGRYMDNKYEYYYIMPAKEGWRELKIPIKNRFKEIKDNDIIYTIDDYSKWGIGHRAYTHAADTPRLYYTVTQNRAIIMYNAIGSLA
jgi:hypothetical protein